MRDPWYWQASTNHAADGLAGCPGPGANAPSPWFTAEGAKAIGSYDPAKKKADWILGTGQNRTHMIFVSQDLKHIFTTNVSSGTLSIIEKSTQTGPDAGPPPGFGPGYGGPPPERANRPVGPPAGPGDHHGPMDVPGSDWDETVVPVGRGGEGFDVSPDGKEIWVANAQDGTVSIVRSLESV